MSRPIDTRGPHEMRWAVALSRRRPGTEQGVRHRPLAPSRKPAFDYNANGRIDFADVVWLFNHL